jgi:hypothetical protein
MNTGDFAARKWQRDRRWVEAVCALSASRSTECVLICLLGGVLGVFFAAAAVRWLTTYWLNLPRAEAIHRDVAVLAFAAESRR